MKMKKHHILFLILILAGLLSCVPSLTGKNGAAYAAEAGTTGGEATPTPAPVVKLESVDYDELWLKVNANGNNKVYYSDKSKKVWYDAVKAKDGFYYIDISWISNTSAVLVNLKGDVCDEVVGVTLPARNSKVKAKYNKVTGAITFENVDGATTFEWRKATAYTWQSVTIEDAKKVGSGTQKGSAFWEEIEKMRITGGQIYVRIPQTKGEVKNGEFVVGTRQSKEIKISITKRANAPKVTIDGSKMVLNTKDTMEYSTDNGLHWNPAKAKMPISSVALAAYNGTSSVTVLFRTAETDKKAYSKAAAVEIPKRRPAPSVGVAASAEVVWESGETKFFLTFNQASKTMPYEYTIVKGTGVPDEKSSWKAVTSSKTVSVTDKTAPAGSTIYVRKRTIKEGKETKFELASKEATIKVTYTKPTLTPAQGTGTK